MTTGTQVETVNHSVAVNAKLSNVLAYVPVEYILSIQFAPMHDRRTHFPTTTNCTPYYSSSEREALEPILRP